jgi:hypothetical protein
LTFVDRHPLFSKPREFYETSNGSKVAKTAAATFVGIPAGFVGEMRQILAGRTPGTSPAVFGSSWTPDADSSARLSDAPRATRSE